MWIAIVSSVIGVLVLPCAVLNLTKWYADRCVEYSKQIVNVRLREYETIAQQ
jgi:hypothetical protein